MNEIERYLHELKQELRDLPEGVQSDLLAEVQTHIEDGLEDETLVDKTAVQHTILLRELGSPAELVRNLHWSNWKRNGRNAALAIIPLLPLNPLSVAIDRHLGVAHSSTVLSYAIRFIVCLGMVLLARHLHSRLLTGWWLSNTLATVFFAFLHSVSWPNSWLPGTFWWLSPLVLAMLVGGFYGRFLWQNRHDGLTITLTLTPFMWQAIDAFSIRPLVLVPGHDWRQFWTGALVMNVWFLIVLAAFLYPGRRQRWQILSALFAVCTLGSMALWLPSGSAGIWFLLLPILLGWGTELAANRHYKQSLFTAST